VSTFKPGLVGATICLCLSHAHAESRTVADARSEVCARTAEHWFDQEYGGERFGVKLQHHYNRKGKVCYALVTHRRGCEQLFDINDPSHPREEAIYCGQLCRVKETKCTTESEWEGLVRPYLEQ